MTRTHSALYSPVFRECSDDLLVFLLIPACIWCLFHLPCLVRCLFLPLWIEMRVFQRPGLFVLTSVPRSEVLSSNCVVAMTVAMTETLDGKSIVPMQRGIQ